VGDGSDQKEVSNFREDRSLRMPVIIVEEECEGCGTCIPMCPNSSIVYKEINDRTVAEIVEDECVECGECIEYCLREAIKET